MQIDTILVGTPRPLGPKGVPSSIAAREPVAGPVPVGELGLMGDQVGDPKVHGGPEKAVHLYPSDHYAAWAAEQPAMAPLLGAPGAFGENLSVAGVTEGDVCLGDVVRAGTALLQICQTRQPCWKLGARFGIPELPRLFQRTGRTGWYYRVLEPGALSAGDRLETQDRPNPAWPLSRVIATLYDRTLDPDALADLAACAGISANLRALALRRIETSAVEDWSRRLDGVGA